MAAWLSIAGLWLAAMGLLYVHGREIFDLTWMLLAALAVILYMIFVRQITY